LEEFEGYKTGRNEDEDERGIEENGKGDDDCWQDEIFF
jgi:hypothetical protein